MAINPEYINETIAHIAAVEAKAVVQAILVEREDGDEVTRYRGDKAGFNTQARQTLTRIHIHIWGKEHLSYSSCGQSRKHISC